MSGPEGWKRREVVAAFVVRAVVAGEDDEGVVGEAELVEVIEQAADVAVEAGDHGGVALVLGRPIGGGIGAVIGDMRAVFEVAISLVVGVRDDRAPIEEEGAGLMLGDELEGFVGEEIIGIEQTVAGVTAAVVADGGDVVGQGDFGFVAPEELGEVVVGVVLAEVAEEVIEAMVAGQAAFGFADVAEAPFADERGGVAGLLEDAGHGEILGAQGLGERISRAGVAAHAGVAVVLAGHEDAPRRGADRGAGVELGEPQAFARHAIEVRRLDDVLTVATEFAVAEIIGHDPDQVGAVSGGTRPRTACAQNNQQQRHQAPARDG